MNATNDETTMTISRTNFPEDTTGCSGLGFQDDSDGECTGLAVVGDPPMPGDDSAAALSDRADGSGDDGEWPQPVCAVELPEDFDYRDLQPRRYGKSLPPLSDLERQNLKTSIIGRGFFGRILIDEWLRVIDGNTRLELCLEMGVAPVFEMISGLSEEEKEELALSCNVDRRHLDRDAGRQVLEARFENMFKLREKDPKKWTQQSIAAVLGVSVATVSLRESLRHTSDGKTMSKPDARRKYDEDIEREAVRLVKEGMPQAEVARKLLMNPKAVQRAVNKVKKQESGTATDKDGKSKKASADSTSRPTHAIGSTVPNDGIPRIHRLALESLRLEPRDYAERLERWRAEAREAVEAVSDNVDELLHLSLHGSQLAAAADLRLRQILKGGEDGVGEVSPDDPCPDSHGIGTVHIGSVLGVESDGIYISLPGGAAGVIDIGDMSLIVNTRPDEGDTVRVRVKGFDPGRDLLDLSLQGRQTFAQADRTTAIGPQSDDRCSPDVELSGHKAGPQVKEVL